jgi:hypothetical protein
VRRLLLLAFLVTLFAAFSAAAQSPDATGQTSTCQPKSPAPPAEPKKAKKVWTNEDLPGVHGAISDAGNRKNTPKTKTAAAKPVDAKYVESARKQLAKLQEQIAEADKQLVDLKNFNAGEPSRSAGGMKLNKHYDSDSILVQIRGLEERVKDLKSKMDELLDEARKKGLEPGQLR